MGQIDIKKLTDGKVTHPFDVSGWPINQVESTHTRFVQSGVISKTKAFGLFVSSTSIMNAILLISQSCSRTTLTINKSG